MSHFLDVSDLNAELRESVAFAGTGDAHAYRQVGVRPVDGSSSVEEFRSHRRALRWRSSCARIQLRQPIALHGVCAADLSRELARYHDLSAGAVCQALPSGIRGMVARSTLADANEPRDWRIYAEFAQHLIRIARRLYIN